MEERSKIKLKEAKAEKGKTVTPEPAKKVLRVRRPNHFDDFFISFIAEETINSCSPEDSSEI